MTSYTAAAEPRGPRHAVCAKLAFPDADVMFIDMAACGICRPAEPELLRGHAIKRLTIEFPTRASSMPRLVARKFSTQVARVAFTFFGVLTESLFGDRTQGLTRMLKRIRADVYIAHNIETLLPAINAARGHGAAVIFDCMEFYSDMGDNQLPVEAAAARKLEAGTLPSCALVLASSDVMADSLAAEYAIRRPLAAYNVPPTVVNLPARRGDGLNLYWRNSVIGFGQRGLQDVLDALAMLPDDVHLYLQGRLPEENARVLAARITALRLRGRVHVVPPYVPHEAVQEAALYDIGLCLERKGPRNHDLTVSNKMFDYHMAGLAVIATDLHALADVVNRSGGGLLCAPGDPKALAVAVDKLYSSPALLEELQLRARAFALAEANLEVEIDKIVARLKAVIGTERHKS